MLYPLSYGAKGSTLTAWRTPAGRGGVRSDLLLQAWANATGPDVSEGAVGRLLVRPVIAVPPGPQPRRGGGAA